MAKTIDNRDTLTDHIADAMHSMYRAWSIDTLLIHPHDAIKMGEVVCKKMGWKPTPEKIHEVCRAALAARKRGAIRSK